MNEKHPRLISAVATIGIGSMALTGCNIFGKEGYAGSVNQATVVSGTVQEGADLYFSPTVRIDHNDGTSNRCTRTSKSIKLDGKSIAEPVINDDPNGQFTGLMLSELPKDLRDKCSSGSTGTVWVKTIFVKTNIDKDSVIQIPGRNDK